MTESQTYICSRSIFSSLCFVLDFRSMTGPPEAMVGGLRRLLEKLTLNFPAIKKIRTVLTAVEVMALKFEKFYGSTLAEQIDICPRGIPKKKEWVRGHMLLCSNYQGSDFLCRAPNS